MSRILIRIRELRYNMPAIARYFSFAFLAILVLSGLSYGLSMQQKWRQAKMCLAENIYFEARGEPTDAKYKVGLLTIARMSDPDPQWPKTICGVVAQNHRFSWTLDYRLATTVAEQQKMKEAENIADDLVRNAWTRYVLPKGWECARYYHRTDNHGVSQRSKRDTDANLFPVGYFGHHTAFQERHGCRFPLPTS